MEEYWHLINCANCGHQTMIGKPEDTCLFCGKNTNKKEVIMAEKDSTEERGAIPPKPKNRKKVWGYYEKNKEAMVADYNSMRVSSFFLKWGISSQTWPKLKKKWGISNKTKGRGSKQVEKTTQRVVKETTSEDTALTEHERYLILLGYQQAVREIFRAK